MGLAISFSLLLILAIPLGLRPAWTWLLLPIPLITLQILGFALGLLFGTLNFGLWQEWWLALGGLVVLIVQLNAPPRAAA